MDGCGWMMLDGWLWTNGAYRVAPIGPMPVEGGRCMRPMHAAGLIPHACGCFSKLGRGSSCTELHAITHGMINEININKINIIIK